MAKKVASILICFSLRTLAQAHEFWLHPAKFILAPGERIDVRFMVGENFIGEPWDLTKHRIEKLDLYQIKGVRDVRDSVRAAADNLSISVKNEGTCMLAMQSSNALIELEAEKFNEYLKEDGQDDILELRRKTNSLNKAGKEFYTRYTKLLLQVGEVKDDTYKKEVGFPIEIIPEKNPYLLKKGDPVSFKILFEGKPVFGAKVKVWNRFENRTTIQNIYTEKNGVIETHISNPGPWMVSVVKMIPSKDKGADWQSYWGSLVFGIK
jgi:uncharacterized GH25 family protein